MHGGSALVAYRLAKMLKQRYGTENLILVRSKFSSDPDVIQTRRNKFEEKIEWFVNIIFNLLGLQYKFIPFSPKRILKITNQFKPDIISLHNPIGGYFRINDLVSLSKLAPIVWTLHDMWAFTGNASHTLGNEDWKKLKSSPGEKNIFPWIGLNTGNWLLRQKQKIYSKSNLKIIAPSTWMYNQALQSPAFKGKNIELIHHGIDLQVFKPLNKNESKSKLRIPVDGKTLMFSAEKFGSNNFKGGKDFQNILNQINDIIKEKIYVIILGSGRLDLAPEMKNIEFIKPGYITDEKKIVQCYSAADIFVYPTKADSFGLVLLESIACGTPAITFNIGGCPDIIKDGVSGYLIPPFMTELFAKRCIALLNNKSERISLSNSCRKYAEENFSLVSMTEKYYKVFSDARYK